MGDHQLKRNRLFTQTAPASAQLASIIYIGLGLVAIILSTIKPDLSKSLRSSAFDLSAPLLRVARLPAWSVQEEFAHLKHMFHQSGELTRLAEENRRLRAWQQRAITLESENKELRSMLNVPAPPAEKKWTARILANSGHNYVHAFTVNLGTADGVRKGVSAMTPDGVVGRVVESGQNSARVLMLNDINSRIPVQIEGSRIRAILTGTNTAALSLEHLKNADWENIKAGQRIVTSGHGGLFPPGLPVGRVQSIHGETARIAPYADFDKLTWVQLKDFGLDPNLPRNMMLSNAVDTAQ